MAYVYISWRRVPETPELHQRRRCYPQETGLKLNERTEPRSRRSHSQRITQDGT
jgi:hypothetical protein